MASNFPGPFEIRVSVATEEPAVIGLHTLRFSCQMGIEADPGDPFDEWFPVQKNGGNALGLDEHVEDLLTVLAPIYASAAAFGNTELWEYDEGTFDAVFRASYNPTAQPTNANPTVTASQTIFSFRTAGGGIMKATCMGTAIAPAAGGAYPQGEAILDDIFEYFVLSSSPWWGRDNSYPVAALNYLPGQNEALWKRVFRS